MKTDDLIRSISADATAPGMPMSRTLALGLAGAILLVAVAFYAMLGPRSDISSAMQTVRFLFKFVVTGLLAATAWFAARTVALPEGNARNVLPWLLAAPLLLVLAAASEMMLLPEGERMTRMIGTNSMLCLTAIPALGLAPLAVFLLALRHGAPSNPGLAGVVAGVLAGGVAATFYAAHCTDDSPLFVALWYTVAIAMLAAVGGIAGRFLLRW